MLAPLYKRVVRPSPATSLTTNTADMNSRKDEKITRAGYLWWEINTVLRQLINPVLCSARESDDAHCTDVRRLLTELPLLVPSPVVGVTFLTTNVPRSLAARAKTFAVRDTLAGSPTVLQANFCVDVCRVEGDAALDVGAWDTVSFFFRLRPAGGARSRA